MEQIKTRLNIIEVKTSFTIKLATKPPFVQIIGFSVPKKSYPDSDPLRNIYNFHDFHDFMTTK